MPTPAMGIEREESAEPARLIQSPKPPLRVGLLLDSFVQPLWVKSVIEDLQRSGIVDLALIIKRASAAVHPAPQRRRLLARMVQQREYLLHALYQRLDRRLFPVDPNPFETTDIEALLQGCPVLRVIPRTTKHCDYFSDEEVDLIRGYDLDVVVRFGFRILKGKALEIARFGVWSYHHGDNLVNRGGPPGHWEVMEGHVVTGSILQVLTEDLDAGKVLYRSYMSTDLRSVHRNRSKFYWQSSTFLLRRLRDLHVDGPEALCDSSGESDVWQPYSNRLYTRPRNGEMVRGILRIAKSYLGDRARSLYAFDQWFLAYTLQSGTASSDGVPADTPYRFRVLLPPKDRFWADPFPVVWKGHHFIFLEELIYRNVKAHISLLEVGPKGPMGAPVKVLERDYHLSYPFVFEWQGAFYMIPESGANRTVELYRATEFPFRWELDRLLLSGRTAVDATLAELGGRWWMFVNIAALEGMSTHKELHLFYADTPLGPWTPHRRNPIKSDVRSARPAGRLFQWRGHWYRPSQDCSVSYGHAIVFNRIEQLNPYNFREIEVSRLTPSWMPNINGTHTINTAGGLTAIDARIRRHRIF